MSQPTPIMQGDTLTYQQSGEARTLLVGSPEWWAWLAQASAFAVETSNGHFSARKEQASNGRGGGYWRAYRKRGAQIRRAYLGKDSALTLERLQAAAAQLAGNEAAAQEVPLPVLPPATPPLDPIVATKLALPPEQPQFVARNDLLAWLAEHSDAVLTTLIAPAGFGKTTLLVSWLRSAQMRSVRVAWLALDDGDNSLPRFWNSVVAALDHAQLGLIEAVAACFQPPFAVEPLLHQLVNAVAQQPGTVLLVLDDYHLIEATAIHQSLGKLLALQPPNLRLVVASRAALPLSLARLRAHGRLAELTADDLRFGVAESRTMLNHVLRLDLSDADVAHLTARTEGWVVGLRLAALAIERHADPSAFVQSFSGTHRYVFDYLADEVFIHQPAHIQMFLLETSILDRLNGDLCDAILGDWRLAIGDLPSQSPVSYSQALLEQLERLNLFLTPLDDEHRWYRYHALFADFLRSRLAQNYPNRVPELHRRAAAWHEAQHLDSVAIDHALAAVDYKRASRLVETRTADLLARRETTVLLDWLRRFPAETVRSNPRLCLAFAAALLLEGQRDAIEPYLLAAVGALHRAETQHDAQNVLGEIAALRAAAAALDGQVARALALSHQALSFLPAENGLVRGFATASLGLAALAGGEVVDAGQNLADAAAISQAAGNAYLSLVAQCALAYSYVARGQLRTAADTYRRALRQAEQWGGQLVPVAGWAAVGLAGLLYEWDDLDAADAALAQGIERCEQWGSLVPLLVGYSARARVQHARGDRQGAIATIAQARQLAVAANAGRLGSLLDALEATLRLSGGDRPAAERWAEMCDLRDDWANFEHGSEHLALARVLIVQGRERNDSAVIVEAMWLLNQLQQAAAAAHWTGRLVQIYALQALAEQALGNPGAAITTLGRALALAAPEGYVRTFLDEGAPMAALLRLAATRGESAAYARRLAAAFGNRAGTELPAATALIEQLTERELSVLRAVAAGQTPDDIAGVMFLAPSTIKWHLKAIYRKLDVHNRTAAVAAARTLGLLD